MKKSVLWLIVCWLSLPLSGQGVGEFGETLEVRIINVDVVVVDKDGDPVRGLKASDFTIKENGDSKTISNFAEYRAASSGSVTATIPEQDVVTQSTPEKRYLVFFIDRLRLEETENRKDFIAGLRRFVDESMRPGDEGAVYGWGTSLEIRVPPTTDKSLIRAEIDGMEDETSIRVNFESMEQSDIDMRARMYGSEEEGAAENAEMDIRIASQRAFDEQQRKTDAINAVVRSVAGLDGRKILVLATHRFSKLPGLEYGYAAGEFNARRMIDSVAREANAADVTVYGFHPAGLIKDMPSATATESTASQSYQLLMNEAESVTSIAERTGGIAALGGKLSQLALEDVTSYLDNYYSIAYHADSADRDGVRKIKVTVDRDRVDVLVRTNVIDKSEDERVRDRVVSGLLFGSNESVIQITATQGQVRKTGFSKWTIPVTISIPIAQLTALPVKAGYEGRFKVFAGAADPNGTVSDVAQKEQAFRIPEEQMETAMKGVFNYSLEIKVSDRSDRVVVAVWDTLSHEIGFAEVAISLDGAIESAETEEVKVKAGETNPAQGGRSRGNRGSGKVPR